MKSQMFILLALVSLPAIAQAEITRIWLSHRTNDPSKIVVSWESATPGNSVVRFGADQKPLQTVSVDENVTLHHVEIRLAEANTSYHYTPRPAMKSLAKRPSRRILPMCCEWPWLPIGQGNQNSTRFSRTMCICCSRLATTSAACINGVGLE